MNHAIIVESIKCRKDELGLSFNALEGISGVSASTIKRMFKGAHVDFENIEKVASSLGIELEVRVKQQKISRKALYERKVNMLVEKIIARVVGTSALEMQKPDDETIKTIRANALRQIQKLPEARVWQA